MEKGPHAPKEPHVQEKGPQGVKGKDMPEKPERKEISPPKPGSQCLPGRKGRGLWGDLVSKNAGITAEGFVETLVSMEAAATFMAIPRRKTEGASKEKEPAAKEQGGATLLVEEGGSRGGEAAAVDEADLLEDLSLGAPEEEGAQVSKSVSPGSPFKLRAKRMKGPNVEDDVGPGHQTAPENLYSADRTTYKELAGIAGVSGSPAAVPEVNVRTRARTAKEAEQAAEESAEKTRAKGKKNEKVKGGKVGGAASQKRRRGVAT
jgi:hypothetical protein